MESIKEKRNSRSEKEIAAKQIQQAMQRTDPIEADSTQIEIEHPALGSDKHAVKILELEKVNSELSQRVHGIEASVENMMQLLLERLPPKMESREQSAKKEKTVRDFQNDLPISEKETISPPKQVDGIKSDSDNSAKRSWAQVVATPYPGTRASVRLDPRLFDSEKASSSEDDRKKKERKRRESSKNFRKKKDSRSAKKHRDYSSSSSSSSSSDSAKSSSDGTKGKFSSGKDSDDSSLSTQSEDSNDLKRRMKRRKSLLEIFQDQDRHSDRPSNMLRMQPDYEKIKLEDLHVSSVFRFKDELIRYRQENQVTVQASLRESKAIFLS